MTTEEKIKACYASAKSYPDLAAKLKDVGVLSYVVDVSSKIILYRLAGGETILQASTNEPAVIASAFNEAETRQAIRDSQQAKITYPEFMQRMADSGVRFYEATINGQNPRVTYIGIGGYYDEPIPMNF